MPISKKRKGRGKNPAVPSADNQVTRLAGARHNKEFMASMRKTNFEMRQTENRRARAKAQSEGKLDPFEEEQQRLGSHYKVGDKVKNSLKGTRTIVEVQAKNGEISYAWQSLNDAGICSEKTMIKYAS